MESVRNLDVEIPILLPGIEVKTSRATEDGYPIEAMQIHALRGRELEAPGRGDPGAALSTRFGCLERASAQACARARARCARGTRRRQRLGRRRLVKHELALERAADPLDLPAQLALDPLGVPLQVAHAPLHAVAEMYLMHCLRRLDVWPVGDLDVRAGFALAWQLDPRPTVKQLQPLGDPFRPYRSVVARYCQEAVFLSRSGKGPGSPLSEPD